jgi:hypothetical protein
MLKKVEKQFGGKLAYTSFGHAGFHPRFPWNLFDKYCDFTMPQIYFELFDFGKDDEAEIQACLDAYKNLKLTKPIYPLWASEPGAPNPASIQSLQGYLDRFEGSSIWRAPSKIESCHAFELNYSPDRAFRRTGSRILFLRVEIANQRDTRHIEVSKVKVSSISELSVRLQKQLFARGILPEAEKEFD